MLIVLAAILVMGGMTQVVAIIRLAILRKRFGRLPHLSEQPSVRTWLKLCGAMTMVCALAAIAAVVVTKGEGWIFLVGLGAVLLMIAAHSIADNNTSPGDGDSGG